MGVPTVSSCSPRASRSGRAGVHVRVLAVDVSVHVSELYDRLNGRLHDRVICVPVVEAPDIVAVLADGRRVAFLNCAARNSARRRLA